MDYRKGTDVLPARLVKEIQEYVEGTTLYIPKKSGKAGWGSLSGARCEIDRRNKEMARLFAQGTRIKELADRFHLSEDTVRKIVYGRK